MSPAKKILAAACAAIAMSAVLGPASALASGKDSDIPQSTCFWTNEIASKFSQDPANNYAFPDTGAVYWTSSLAIPSGASVVLKGKYAHSRYQSINSYDAVTHAPTDALNDVSTVPDKGSTNPYLPGADRDAKKRSFTATIVNEPVPSTRAQNTLYAGVAGQERQTLMFRVYLPDHYNNPDELTGGVGLPKAELHLSDGSVLTGQAACDALQVQAGRLPLTTLSQTMYEGYRVQAGKPATFPAEVKPVFNAFYNVLFSLGCYYQANCPANPQRTGGQYSNIDNNYVLSFVNRGFSDGPVLVLRGKMPKTPETGPGVKTMGTGQMRYWSMCQNESLYTTKGAGCVYDSQVPLSKHRRYTIVTSAKADRPKNAKAKCGVAYIPWPAAGDGDGHLDDGMLLVRNMLPSAKFHQAVQDTKTPGDEASVMGPYLPNGSYTTKADFQHNGC